jgi:hypothetical protein
LDGTKKKMAIPPEEDDLRITPAKENEVPVVLRMIKAFAEYEHISHRVTATEAGLRQALFGPQPAAEVVIAYVGSEAVGFAVFFSTFSTFPDSVASISRFSSLSPSDAVTAWGENSWPMLQAWRLATVATA